MSQESEQTRDSCSCLVDIPKDLTRNLNKRDEYKNSITKISFKDLGWTTIDWQIVMRLSTTLELDMTTRKTPKKLPIFFNFCPFCGIKYK